MSSTAFVVVGLVTGLTFAGFLVVAAIAYKARRRKFAGYLLAEGKIVDLDLHVLAMGDSPGSYYPVVEFKPPSGETIRFESNFGSRLSRYKVGQAVMVLYDPDDPRQAEIDSTMSQRLMPGMLLLFSVLSICMCILFLVFGLVVTNAAG
ncbi:MAG: DUF3592 domain-containing protein [Chloroflexi bacterium]|nr:DUF3592 domain-containing protein [Chloroflexota bacterium]